MGELAFSLAARVLEKVFFVASDTILLAWSLKEDLEKLGETLCTVKAVLLDAEEKKSHNRELNLWLSNLKSVLHDANDALDDVQNEWTWTGRIYKHIGCCVVRMPRFFTFSYQVLFRFRIGRRIKEIRERLDRIADERAKFHLSNRYEESNVVTTVRMEIMSDSFVRDSDVLGREVDKRVILHLLLQPCDENANVTVIPICGIGGMGKTTLAKFVYNDERVRSHFELKMWVCVSEDFNVPRLMKEILDSATGKVNKNMTLDQMQIHLRDEIKDKKFLLVLDDVWNDIPDKWFRLREFLLEGSKESKILVTTRKLSVANLTGTIPTYHLGGLSEQHCLSLFLKWAFKEEKDQLNYPHLVDIGKQIAEKCKGVPLAVRTLGSLLHSKVDERDWIYIRDNGIWTLEQREDHILPALRLSYDELPSHLKRCFFYCSLFPKDYQFKSSELIQLWMAHGVLQSPEERRSPEEIGELYFKELWSRSFFQDVEKRGLFYSFYMHDLIHDLAFSVTEGECATLNSTTKNIQKSARHLSIADGIGDEIPASLDNLDPDRLRTIIFPLGAGSIKDSLVDKCLLKFNYLRMLNLSNSSFKTLPSSIGRIKHLRYIDLSGNNKIRRLPNSICELQNLQTLALEDCDQLQGLPRDIKNLINLRFLSLTTTETCFPANGIECLTSLRTLIITSCESLTSLSNDIIKSLTALETLVVYNCEKLVLTEGNDNEVAKLSLRTVMFVQLPKVAALPQWLEACETTLQHLRIWHCPNLTKLPKLTLRPSSVEKIEIMECPKLASLPDGMDGLASLGKLAVSGCPKLWRITLLTNPRPREGTADYSGRQSVPRLRQSPGPNSPWMQRSGAEMSMLYVHGWTNEQQCFLPHR